MRVRNKMADQVHRYPLFRGRFSHEPNRFRSQSSSLNGQFLFSIYLVHFLLVWNQWECVTRWPIKSIVTRCSGADKIMSPTDSDMSLLLLLVSFSPASIFRIFYWFGISQSEKKDDRISACIPFVRVQSSSTKQRQDGRPLFECTHTQAN